MVYYLPPSSESESGTEAPVAGAVVVEEMSDLKIFWGPDICRLEYLVHLMETGRIKDEHLLQAS